MVIVGAGDDRALRGLRDAAAWERAIALFPLAAHWRHGEPLDDVKSMAAHRRPQPPLRRRRASGRHRCRRPRRRLGLHQPVARPGRVDRPGARAAPARPAPEVGPDRPRGAGAGFDEATRASVEPLLPPDPTLRPPPPGRDRRRHRRARPTLPTTRWAIDKALRPRASADDEVLRAFSSVAGLLATADEALGRPGVFEWVIALGADAPRYPLPGPDRAELLAAIARLTPTTRDVRHTMRAHRRGRDRPRRDRRQGPPVLLLHGWPDTHDLWRHQVAALTAAGYRTIAPDLRGFGASDKPDDVDAYGIQHHVGDLLGILDHLGVERAHVVGHDWGGAIAGGRRAGADRFDQPPCLSVGHPARLRHRRLRAAGEVLVHAALPVPRGGRAVAPQDGCANFAGLVRPPRGRRRGRPAGAPAAVTASLGSTGRHAARGARGAPGRAAARSPCPPSAVVRRRHRADRGDDDRHRAVRRRRPWRYARIEGAGHWLQLDAPDAVNGHLLDHLREVDG